MTDRIQPRIFITDDEGRPVGSADIDTADPDAATASLRLESGQLPFGSRERLVDAVLDDTAVCSCTRVQIAVPLGDTGMIDRVRDRCAVHGTRAAGTTCLLDVTPPQSPRS